MAAQILLKASDVNRLRIAMEQRLAFLFQNQSGPSDAQCVLNPNDGLYYRWVPRTGDIDPVSGQPVIVGIWEQC